jgi:hypothetical protein
MSFMSEQEKLAQLMNAGNPEAESFDSADLLTQSLLNQLGGVSQQKLQEVQEEIVARGEQLDYTPISSFSSEGRTAHNHNPEPQKDLRLIKTISVIHKGLIDVFERSGLNSGIEGNLVTLIEATAAVLNYLGEPTTRFEPLRHLSGLKPPNMVKNANKVLETTLSCYNLGEVSGQSVSDDGSVINIVFSGKSGEIEYVAHGEVSAHSWEGSEAIDYIYTPGSGKMSIKAYEGGKWVDKSDNKNYLINWELEEKDLSLEGNPTDNSNNSTVEELEVIASEENLSDKQEVLSQSLNNDLNDEDEEIEFPISDSDDTVDSDI